MNFNDYEEIWKKQELPRAVDATPTNLRETFETQRQRLAATLIARDLTEAFAGVICLIGYGEYWKQIGRDGWPMGLAMALILGVTLFFVRERLRVRRNRLPTNAPLLAKIEADIAELRHQRRLLSKVWVWYLAPILAALLLHASVILRHVKPSGWERLLGAGAFIALIFWAAWALNRQAVRKWIEPRLAELEKLHRDILSTG